MFFLVFFFFGVLRRFLGVLWGFMRFLGSFTGFCRGFVEFRLDFAAAILDSKYGFRVSFTWVSWGFVYIHRALFYEQPFNLHIILCLALHVDKAVHFGRTCRKKLITSTGHSAAAWYWSAVSSSRTLVLFGTCLPCTSFNLSWKINNTQMGYFNRTNR